MAEWCVGLGGGAELLIKRRGPPSPCVAWSVSRTPPVWDLPPYPLLMCVCRRVWLWGGARVSVVRSQRWLMVYRRTLMGDSSQPAREISVAPRVTYNLSPGSEATSPQLCGMRHIHSLLLSFLKRLPASQWSVKLCSGGVRPSVRLLAACMSVCIFMDCPSITPVSFASLRLIQIWTDRTRRAAQSIQCERQSFYLCFLCASQSPSMHHVLAIAPRVVALRSHRMTERPTLSLEACSSSGVWLLTGCSVYLHIWLPVSCPLAVSVLVFSTDLSCVRVSACCFSPPTPPTHSPLCPPVRLALWPSNRRDWHRPEKRSASRRSTSLFYEGR